MATFNEAQQAYENQRDTYEERTRKWRYDDEETEDD